MSCTPPRVLILNWRDRRNPLAGGAEVHIWEVFTRLVARGWPVEAVCAGFCGAPARECVGGIPVTRIAGPMTYHLALPRASKRVAERFMPEVVVDFMNKLPLYTPLFVRAPLCCFVHHLFGASAIRETGWLSGACLWAYERPVPWLYGSTPFLTGSRSSIEELRRLGVRNVAPEPLPYGADTQWFTPGARAPEPTILYLGRLKQYKGVDHLIGVMPELLRALPGLTLRIAGTGGARPRLEALAARLRVADAVIFHGFVTEEEKRRLYQEAWVNALPSHKEGFGLTIPEAALCATPTVGYDVPGLRDAITDRVTGLLAPYGDRKALAGALLQVLADGQLRQSLGDAARSRYLDFSWDHAAAHMEAYLMGLARQRREAHGGG